MNERNQFKGVSSIKFYKAFSTDEDCYGYLTEIKWHETEFHCKKCGRAYAQVISDASSTSFKPFFETYISKDAKIITDVFRGYIPLKKITQIWNK